MIAQRYSCPQKYHRQVKELSLLCQMFGSYGLRVSVESCVDTVAVRRVTGDWPVPPLITCL
jgi:hypothetical protein